MYNSVPDEIIGKYVLDKSCKAQNGACDGILILTLGPHFGVIEGQLDS